MNCRQTEDVFLDYLYGELEAGKAKVFEEHLAQCPDCTAKLIEFRRVRELVAGLSDPEPSGVLIGHVLAQAREQAEKPARLWGLGWLKVLATLCVIGVVGGLVVYQLKSGLIAPEHAAIPKAPEVRPAEPLKPVPKADKKRVETTETAAKPAPAPVTPAGPAAPAHTTAGEVKPAPELRTAAKDLALRETTVKKTPPAASKPPVEQPLAIAGGAGTAPKITPQPPAPKPKTTAVAVKEGFRPVPPESAVKTPPAKQAVEVKAPPSPPLAAPEKREEPVTVERKPRQPAPNAFQAKGGLMTPSLVPPGAAPPAPAPEQESPKPMADMMPSRAPETKKPATAGPEVREGAQIAAAGKAVEPRAMETLQQADQDLASGKYQLAVVKYGAVLMLLPPGHDLRVRALLGLAQSYEALGDRPKAKKAYQDLAAASPAYRDKARIKIDELSR